MRAGAVITRIGRKLDTDLEGNVVRRWPGRHATQRRLPGGEAAVYRGPIWHIRRLWPHRKYPVPLNTTDVRIHQPAILVAKQESPSRHDVSVSSSLESSYWLDIIHPCGLWIQRRIM